MRRRRQLWVLAGLYGLAIGACGLVWMRLHWPSSAAFFGGWAALSLVFVLAGGAGAYFWVTRPLEKMLIQVGQYGLGNFDKKIPQIRVAELENLAVGINMMSWKMEDRLREILRRQHEQEMVLNSMAEGVIAVDGQERILNLNHAAGRFFDVRPDQIRGKNLVEVLRIPAIQQLVGETLGAEGKVEKEVELFGPEERILLASGAPLVDEKKSRLGALLVLNDITRVRTLERIRTDFVANVSHELKTPLTLMQGFVETLLDGALKDPGEARRFLEIILAQAVRLHAIVEDLLTLSSLEQGKKESLRREPRYLRELLENAVALILPAAEAKSIQIDLVCDDRIMADVNATLLEQAVVNLLDNAVKYTGAGTRVKIQAARKESEIGIAISDEGPGIAPEHLPRLFERFYRVDKSRSRKAGGTGLGLAIVKHILQAHGGRVDVESASGKGSTFTLIFPQVEIIPAFQA